MFTQFFRFVVFVHVWVYRVSGGVWLSKLGRRDILLLTTTGRKTGRDHVVALTYLDRGGSFFVVASGGGSEFHPAWYLNLVQMEVARVQVNSDTYLAQIDILMGTERERVWREFVQVSEVFASDSAKTTREIPVVRLTPVQDSEVEGYTTSGQS